ncbi:TRADD-N-associated membrane domain-containing protein [Anabaena cylindrica]|uniref:Cyanobacterial TRADD-N associated 2 transmembrane domain-containing protein n=1 Tax=Anabaena cylindrica (strain ATCC 27899 / PCC 7122) TaxID=272123 RepID=K9ZD97_ANACC|nr:hypothetical protein [Anabaena cylindrica]AFZ56587.1 hypothetical protein Anacy_1012 [Anabaena cylindrica PCC 7122]
MNDKDPYRMIRLDIAQEHLRQARQTFNLSLVSSAASICISVVGAFLLISGKANEGSVTTATGLLSTTYCSQIAQKSSKTLEELRENFKKNILLANREI